MAHQITILSEHGSKLLFARMSATEQLGKLFSYRVQLLSEDAEVNLRKLLGKSMTVQMTDGVIYRRFFNGIVSEAAQMGFQTIADVRYAVYSVTLVPKPWLLSRIVDCRIYTDMSVPDIVSSVLGEIGYADVKLSLSADYPKREYCVQYREDSLNFISRLMEQEGIYYYFTHTASTHTMVLADALGAHAPAIGFELIPYCPPLQKGSRNAAAVTDWGLARSMNSLQCQLTDYDPLKPKASLLATELIDNGSDYHDTTGLNVFDYPGLHAVAGDGKRYAQVRVEALNVPHLQYEGRTDAMGLATGTLFKLGDFPNMILNQEYLVTGTQFELEESDYASGETGGTPFTCSFQAIESRQPYRSMPSALKPSVTGLQTAVVTGSETDEDIAVDKYGRVQVTFHWNKPDKKNAKSSCPVRVASPWAGKGWGAVSIPRVGQEVVVSFLEGDPDRPLIIGSVYNADNMPPYSLPDNKTQSGIKSRSLSGAAADANEIRMEDKKGSEELFLHAQKDMREEVENDHFVQIDHDEKITIKNDQTEDITGNRTSTVGKDDTLDVKQNGTTTVGKKFKLSAGTEIELVTGQSSIVMKSSGDIEIKGMNIKITANKSVEIVGTMSAKMTSSMDAKVDGGMSVTVKGMSATFQGEATAALKASGITQVSGALIKIG
jgi:type VI secretion system secreted protein VgrG